MPPPVRRAPRRVRAPSSWSSPASGCDRDGVDDLRVARAAAQVAGDRRPDRGLIRSPAGVEMGTGCHQHAGRADPALGPASLEERLLQRIEDRALRGSRSEAFDRRDPRPVNLADRHETRVDWGTVDEHGARATLTLAAAL